MTRPLLRLALAASLFLPAAAFAQATAIWVQAGTGAATRLQSPTAAITVNSDAGHVDASFASGNSPTFVAFRAPSGMALTPGYYDNATSYYSYSGANSSPQITLSSYGITSGCTPAYARFTVLEATYDGGNIVRFAANFETRCTYDSFTTFGEIRINSSIPILADRAAGWTTPDPIVFPARTFVAPGSDVLSEAERVYGINAAASISIVGGSYSINNGPFTSAAGTVSNRDQVRVLVTAPTGFNDSASAQLSIGGTSAMFMASTATTGIAATALRLEGSAGDTFMLGTSTTIAAPEWQFQQSFYTNGSFQFSSYGGASYTVYLGIPNAGLQLGPYENAYGSSFTTSGIGPYLSLGYNDPSNNRSCTGAPGRFVVLEVEGKPGAYTRLAIDFEVICGSKPVYGELRLNSSWPFTFEKAANSTSPDPFAFASLSPVSPGSQVDSSSTTLYGINAPATIQVSGGEYSLNGGAFTSAAGVASNKDHVRVRGMASATPGDVTPVVLTVGGRAASVQIPTFGPGQRITAIRLTGAVQLDVTAPAATITRNGTDFTVPIDTGSVQTVSIRPPTGTGRFSVGSYESVTSETANNAGVSVYYNVSCARTSARLVVLEAVYNAGSTSPDQFAADFQIFCSNAPATFGEVRWNSTIPTQRLMPAGSSLPEAFAFTPRSPAQAGSIAVSNPVAITGINVPVPLSISGGEYSVNSGAFTSAPGVANNGDVVVVRAAAPLTPGATQSATLNAGGRMGAFAVTTYNPGAPTTAFTFTSDPTDPVARGASRTYIGPADRVTVNNFYNSYYMTVYVTGVDGSTASLQVSVPYTQVLQAGNYPNAVISYGTLTQPSLNFSYNNSGCYLGGTGSFNIREMVVSNSTVVSLAIDFTEWCQGAATPLNGEIRLNSSIPTSAFRAPPVVARRGFDTNGDGRNDILFANTDGRTALWLMDGPSQVGGSTLLPASTGWTIAGQGDFNGDGKSDILWKHTDGRVAMWLMNGSTQIGGGALLPAGTGWLPKLVGDFNGDGKADILWEHTDGSSALWIMDGFTQVGGGRLFGGGTGWYAKLLGDLNGDGKADIIWTNTDGRAAVWLMNGSQQVGGGVLITAGTGWTPKLAIDVNGDGKADLVWLNTDGKSAVWLMNGATQAGGGILMNSGSAYVPVLGGDIDGDGKGDIVWRAADGTTIFWLMNGAAQAGGGQILGAGSGWSVVRVADFSGDLIGDLLLVNDDGRVQMRLFDGLGFTSTATLLGAGSGWALVPTP